MKCSLSNLSLNLLEGLHLRLVGEDRRGDGDGAWYGNWLWKKLIVFKWMTAFKWRYTCARPVAPTSSQLCFAFSYYELISILLPGASGWFWASPLFRHNFIHSFLLMSELRRTANYLWISKEAPSTSRVSASPASQHSLLVVALKFHLVTNQLLSLIFFFHSVIRDL